MKGIKGRLAAIGVILLTCGCSNRDKDLIQMVAVGDYGEARVHLQDEVPQDEKDRYYVLDRMRLGVVALADGVPSSCEAAFEESYAKLRTQGLNDDKTLAIALVGDKVAFWKGEPFEQAMTYHYYGLWNAMQGDWYNARAASGESLFNLKDFGVDSAGQRKDAEDIIRDAGTNDEYFDSGYVAVETNFALGYLMHGIANQQIGRLDEARDNYAAAAANNANLRSVADQLENGTYNTILVVDYGAGPEKYGRGPDNAIADFRPVVTSDMNPLIVSIDGRTDEFPIACDLNSLAADHMWKGVEDIRIAKSHIGNVLLGAGAATVAAGSAAGSDEAAYVGLALMLAGMLQKASAAADTTYCEAMPQRTYVAPIDVQQENSTIELQVYGAPASKLVLAGVDPPPTGQAQLKYVRLLGRVKSPPAWATSGVIHYCNDAVPDAQPVHLPYIVGGHCVCTPSDAVLDSCQAAGYLQGMNLSDLRGLYRSEGIKIAGWDAGEPGLHILEGGDWLFTPDSGTTGFARYYGQEHEPYRPKSREVKAVAEQVKAMQLLAASD